MDALSILYILSPSGSQESGPIDLPDWAPACFRPDVIDPILSNPATSGYIFEKWEGMNDYVDEQRRNLPGRESWKVVLVQEMVSAVLRTTVPPLNFISAQYGNPMEYEAQCQGYHHFVQ